VRAQDNTTARAYSTNDRFELRPTAALFNEKANDADVAAGYVAKSGSTMTGQLINNVGFALDTDVTSAPDGKVYLQKRSAGAVLSGYQALIETGSAGSRVERVRVDFDGRVTMPYQPSFFAIGGGAGGGQYFTSINIGDSAVFNRGSHYSTATKRFTAPITGLYHFTAGCLKYSGNTMALQFTVNGNAQMQDYAEGGSGNQNCTIALALYLTAGDYVSARANGGTWYDNGPGTSNYNWFGGCLLS